MSRELQLPVLSVSLVKMELPTVMKNEPPESEIVEIGIDDILSDTDSSESEEEIIPDVKDIDIVYHSVCEESTKRETLESKHCKSVETQVSVNAENSPFIEAENITQRNKTENTSDENITKGQVVVEVQGSNEYSNVLSNLETDAQLVLNFSKDLNGISTRTKKAKQPEKTNFAKCHKIVETTSWEKDNEKIKVIKAPRIHVKAHDYTLAENDYVCNHCQRVFNKLKNVKLHIRKMHREVTTMYQCPYCPYKSKWKGHIRQHIIQKHKDTKDIEWFQCHLCEKKFKAKCDLTKHKKIHLTPKQMQDGLDLKRLHCNKCNYKTYSNSHLKSHKLSHLKPQETQYFYCYHCSYKAKKKEYIKKHIFRHFKKDQVKFDCYICNFMTPNRESIIKHIKKHSKVQNK